MASTTPSYLKIKELEPFFDAAAKGTAPALAVLAESLNNAPSKAPQWVAYTRNTWCEKVEKIFAGLQGNSDFSPEQRALLMAMLNVGLDSDDLSKLYLQLIKIDFPRLANPFALLDALGRNDTNTSRHVVANRLRLFCSITPDITCWDVTNGFGKILAFDETTGEVKLNQGDKDRLVKLAAFLKDEAVVLADSAMDKLLKKEHITFSGENDLFTEAKKGFIYAKDLGDNFIKNLLVPEYYSADEYKKLYAEEEIKAAEAAKQAAPRWDASRSLLELENRLEPPKKTKASKATKQELPAAPAASGTPILDLPDINWENITKILSRDVDRLKQSYIKGEHTELTVRWANVVALLCKEPTICEKLTGILKDLLGQEIAKNEFIKDADSIIAKCLTAFANVTDSLPGKQVLPWMQLVKTLVGEKFLIDGTMLMPFRLWAHTEQLLTSKEERKHFQERVCQDFKNGIPTADHYEWLWKNYCLNATKRKRFLADQKVTDDEILTTEKLKAYLNDAEKRNAFQAFMKMTDSEIKEYLNDMAKREDILADSSLLFRTLHQDLKGNYLKSQRDLHKLLKDDPEFQKALMKQGDSKAISNLVVCVKRLSLLDSSEKTSVLVKIVRLYPEAREIVEENASATVQETLERISSIHSILRLQEDLKTLVEKTIPANTAAIEEARSRGDLSENSEYKYAKEQQRQLNQRRSQMERDLNTCRPIDFADQDVKDRIIPGTVVTLDLQDGKQKVVTLLGLFDTDTEKGWFSYASPMGRVLLSNKVGDTVVLPAGDEATIAKIEKLSDELLEFFRK